MLVWGMMTGAWNRDGHGLDHYINAERKDYREARRTMNLLDRADWIASKAETFEGILREARQCA